MQRTNVHRQTNTRFFETTQINSVNELENFLRNEYAIAHVLSVLFITVTCDTPICQLVCVSQCHNDLL